jgi:hypothetical protein
VTSAEFGFDLEWLEPGRQLRKLTPTAGRLVLLDPEPLAELVDTLPLRLLWNFVFHHLKTQRSQRPLRQ